MWRPDIFVRACWRKLRARPEQCVVQTAWGEALSVGPRRFIGSNVYMRGVHELPVCEALWRLTERGDTVADVGANIGVMTSVLSRRVGKAGRVIAFEAHPGIFQQLQGNVGRWEPRSIIAVAKAVSWRAGRVKLWESEWFDLNEGTASVERATGGRCFEVESVRLDEALGGWDCRLIKIDVENHEREVLMGAEGLLGSGQVREIVFESGWEYPGRAHTMLLDHGYEVFDVSASMWGPVLSAPVRRQSERGRVSDYIATLDSKRVRMLFGRGGWEVLKMNRPGLGSGPIAMDRGLVEFQQSAKDCDCAPGKHVRGLALR